MSTRRPPQVLPDEILVEAEHRGRPVVVAGPPAALGADASPLADCVAGDDAPCSTFFRGFTTTSMEGRASRWDLPIAHEVWGPRDDWVSFTTEQSFLGGPDDPEAVVETVRALVERLRELESRAEA
ncbi:hypothetical protein Hbl1158_09840 [Halobaculum sp. CBA1158]|uniref:hypothetical protein n=1 Tax=Halobaculum sp. CBA1158 TaxID=2904243 RepID=UPI001F3BC9A2|nr:hypothetical protein [Halobaculum sp. CBA1158]UIO98838.1 hypothetical protein Hbl1158_09840 [Halobaculum sp. CBA1158]